MLLISGRCSITHQKLIETDKFSRWLDSAQLKMPVSRCYSKWYRDYGRYHTTTIFWLYVFVERSPNKSEVRIAVRVLGRVGTRILAVADSVRKREYSPNQPELCGRAGWLGHSPSLMIWSFSRYILHPITTLGTVGGMDDVVYVYTCLLHMVKLSCQVDPERRAYVGMWVRMWVCGSHSTSSYYSAQLILHDGQTPSRLTQVVKWYHHVELYCRSCMIAWSVSRTENQTRFDEFYCWQIQSRLDI